MELLSACQGPARNIDEATKRRYQFWDTQPVPKLSKLMCVFLQVRVKKLQSCVRHAKFTQKLVSVFLKYVYIVGRDIDFQYH